MVTADPPDLLAAAGQMFAAAQAHGAQVTEEQLRASLRGLPAEDAARIAREYPPTLAAWVAAGLDPNNDPLRDLDAEDAVHPRIVAIVRLAKFKRGDDVECRLAELQGGRRPYQPPDVVLFAGSAEAVNAFRAEHCGDDPAALGTLIRSEADLDALMPLPSEAERKRSNLVMRLACALDDMAERFPDEPLLAEAPGWKDRPDFEQLLDAWEAGRHPAQLPTE